MQQLQQKVASLFAKKATPVVIGDQTFNFYPLSAKILFDLGTTMKPVGQALAHFWGKHRNDAAQTVETSPDGTTVTHIAAVSPELAKYRTETQTAAVSSALGTLLNENNRLFLGRVLMDSLRDECPRNPTEADVNAFLNQDGMDLDLLVAFLQGTFTANVRVFGPLVQRAAAAAQAKLAELGVLQQAK